MITKHTESAFGAPVIRFACECGRFEAASYDDDGERAEAQTREHLADAHGDQLDVGRCERCQQPTEHFRAVTGFGTVYLCEAHSPAMSDLDTTVVAP